MDTETKTEDTKNKPSTNKPENTKPEKIQHNHTRLNGTEYTTLSVLDCMMKNNILYLKYEFICVFSIYVYFQNKYVITPLFS